MSKEQDPVCFGSAMQRDVLPTDVKYQSSFMRRNMSENRANLGPGSYNANMDAFYELTHRHYSTVGLGSRAPRWFVKHEYQPPLKKRSQPKKPKQNYVPFNQISKRNSLVKSTDYPPPGNYHRADNKKKEIKFDYSFSGKKVLRCAVSIKCVPINIDECGICGCCCSEQGDYWQFEDRIFLCRMHFDQLFKNCSAKFQGIKLEEFKPVRDCAFMHAHDSCKAALKIMKRDDIVKKLRKEAYLDLFFPQRRACN